MKRLKKHQKIITIILAIIVLIYVVYAMCLLIANPTDIYILTQGTLSEEDETVGYIIRDEQVIKDENHENGIYALIPEGQRVAKNEYIFRYYSEEEKETKQKINELNYQIEEKIDNINKLTNYQEIIEYKNYIDSLISKKINYIGEITENKEIKQLIKERKQLEEQLTNGAEYKTAPISGIVSYRVDGLEEQLSVNNLSEINSEKLENIEIRTGQIIASSNEYGKVIDNFKCYIVAVMDSEMAKQAEVGKTVTIRTSSGEECNAKIIQINEESGKRTIIFQINKMTEELINHRKIAIEVIWWNKSGYKVPNQVLIEEEGLYYIMKKKSGTETKMLVKIEEKTEKFSIISSYSAKELQELGYNENQIRNYKKINNYDEIIINPKK